MGAFRAFALTIDQNVLLGYIATQCKECNLTAPYQQFIAEILEAPLSVAEGHPLSPLSPIERTAMTKFDALHQLEARLCTIAEEP